MELTCCLLIYLWATDELNVDKFLSNDDRIFQVLQNVNRPDGISIIEATPRLLASTMKEGLPAVKYSVSVIPSSFKVSKGLVSVAETRLRSKSQYVSEDFFDVFLTKSSLELK